MLRALFHTCATVMAKRRIMQELRDGKLRFRIAAPAAAQGAAFEKNCRPDAWSILKAEMLDVENGSFDVLIHDFSESCYKY